jgi:broad specificity phosphatase PhoE
MLGHLTLQLQQRSEMEGPTTSARPCRILLVQGALAEIVKITVRTDDDNGHQTFLDQLRRSVKRVQLLENNDMWVKDRDFPDVPILLTSWPEFLAANENPAKVRIDISSEAPAEPHTNGRTVGQKQSRSHFPSEISNLRRKRTPTSTNFVQPQLTDTAKDSHDVAESMNRSVTFLSGNFEDSKVPRKLPINSIPWAQPFGSSTGNTPLRIFLVRHGESETNVDHHVYDTTADHAVKLTPRGKKMAEDAGRYLRNFLTRTFGSKRNVDHHIRMYVSPFRRTRETAEGLIRSLNDCGEQWIDSVRESTLLAEQDWGAKEGTGRVAEEKYREELERNNIKSKCGGRFWCRMPNGESPFDVCLRISAFFPDLLMAANVETAERRAVKTVIVVSHGITIRSFLTNWCRYSPEWFQESVNPPNCSIQLVEDQHDQGYVFGGWNLKTPIDQPLDVVPLARNPDPQHSRWSMFLNQAASADRQDLERALKPSKIEDESPRTNPTSAHPAHRFPPPE